MTRATLKKGHEREMLRQLLYGRLEELVILADRVKVQGYRVYIAKGKFDKKIYHDLVRVLFNE